MKTIQNNSINEIIIKNSRFITLLIGVDDTTDINVIFSDIKKNYPKATHYCYAYITKMFKKACDDGEPGGTAGMPMLNVLEKENMINTLAITIRYFCGIKLGAGGLVRAYSKSVREALLKSDITEVKAGYLISVVTTYDNQKELDYLLKDSIIVCKEYLTDVSYKVLIAKEKINVLNNYSYQVIKEEYIKSSQ